MLDQVFKPLPDGAGPIGLLSGDELTPAVAPFDRVVLARARGTRVSLITEANPANARILIEIARAHFAELGATVEHLETPFRSIDTDVIYIAGGDPGALLAALKKKASGWKRVIDAWRAGAALVGSSAGAMAMCEHCLVPTPGADRPTEWTSGVGPVEGVGLAVHATTRPAEWLREVVASSHFPVVALDDATGIIAERERSVEVIGAGRVQVLGT